MNQETILRALRFCLLLCPALGVFFTLVSVFSIYVTEVIDYSDNKLLIWIVLMGSLFGFLCGLVAGPLLFRKKFWSTAKWLIIIVTPVIVASNIFAPVHWARNYAKNYELVFFWQVITFIVACLVLNRRLPAASTPGQDQSIGFPMSKARWFVCGLLVGLTFHFAECLGVYFKIPFLFPLVNILGAPGGILLDFIPGIYSDGLGWGTIATSLAYGIIGLVLGSLAWIGRTPPPTPGYCACGYDLTGNESGVCPECGTELQCHP